MAICFFRCVLLGFIFVLGSALLASNKAELDLNVTVHESVQAFESINGAALSAVNGFDVAFANMFVLSNEATGFNIKVSSSLNETCPDEDREIHMFCGSMGTRIPYGIYIAAPEISELRKYYTAEELVFSSCATASTLSSVESNFYVSGSLNRSNLSFNEYGKPSFVNDDKKTGKLTFKACIPDTSSLMLREGENVTVEQITFIFDKAGS